METGQPGWDAYNGHIKAQSTVPSNAVESGPAGDGRRAIRVLVVEDQRALADALGIGIDAQPDLQCVGTVGTVADALRVAAASDPDVVLMDIHLPGADGIEGTGRIRAAHPAARVLILTADATPDLLRVAAAAGAGGFLAKDTAFVDILTAIRFPLEGKLLVEHSALVPLLTSLSAGQRDRAEPDAHPAGLSRRELEVLQLMGEGLDPRAVAERLVVSPHTARGHVKKVMMKLGAHSQLEAVVIATKMGLLSNNRR
jgi:DNA-binding NarL/FixJ family response regulator